MGTTLGVSVMVFVGLWFALACMVSCAVFGALVVTGWVMENVRVRLARWTRQWVGFFKF